jgi:hypothetical protein
MTPDISKLAEDLKELQGLSDKFRVHVYQLLVRVSAVEICLARKGLVTETEMNEARKEIDGALALESVFDKDVSEALEHLRKLKGSGETR